MNVTFAQLRAFIAVAELGHFTRAADRLGVAQSSVSAMIRNLEAALKLKLFDRHTRMLRLTGAGSDLLPVAKKMLLDMEALVDSSRELRALRRGRVSIASGSLQATLILPAIIREFTDRHPDVCVTLHDIAEEHVQQMVRSGQVDIGLGIATSAGHDLKAQVLGTDSYVLLLNRNEPLSRKRRLTWNDVNGAKLIVQPQTSPTRRHLEQSLAAAGVGLFEPAYEVSLPWTMAGLVSAGLGVAVTTGSMQPLANWMRLEMRTPTDPLIIREISLLVHSDRSLSPAAQLFRNLLVARLRADRSWRGDARSGPELQR
jgi:LysR family transcriptional regulator, carnitine catabolism transcriptional activator